MRSKLLAGRRWTSKNVGTGTELVELRLSIHLSEDSSYFVLNQVNDEDIKDAALSERHEPHLWDMRAAISQMESGNQNA